MPQAYMSMGQTAENLAKQYHISQEQQDALAVASQHKAAAAQAAGNFADEIVAVGNVTQDGVVFAPILA